MLAFATVNAYLPLRSVDAPPPDDGPVMLAFQEVHVGHSMRLLIASLVAFVVPAAANGTLSGGVRTSSNAPVPYTRVTWGAVTTGGCINNPGHAWTASNGTWGSPSLSN